MKNLLLSILCLTFYFSAAAQCVVEVPLSQRANASSVIVEGKVISQHSFWNSNNTMIYTSSEVEVYKIFKGSLSTSTISIISEGGTVGLTRITADPALNLYVGDIGVFTCAPPTHMRNLPVNISGIPQFEAYASVQGFVKYDLDSETAADAFHTYTNVETELYPAVLEPSRLTYAEIQSFSLHQFSTLHGPQNPTVQAITGIAPTTITAGTASTITITGSGFGATQGSGSVRFRNADDGGSTVIVPHASQYVSWSSTQIVVEVPQNAGTGTIQVVQGQTFTSAQTLTISYAHLNVDFDPGSGTEAYGTDHVNDNGTGGYTWRMNTAFDADVAMRASFMRAFDSWRCATGVNWTIGATTSINDAVSDGTNIICEDVTAPLAPGILGVCYSYWSGCASGPTIVWYVNELDIIFDDGSNISPLTWEYGPSLPTGSEYDFETVAVHELGHGHQLGHVISPGAIMHYAISNGTSNRALGANDLAGGNFVQSKSVIANVCGPGAMTNHSCGSAPVANFSGTPTSLCAGGTVGFTDLSTNVPTSWSWTFQGGTPSSSSAQHPTITYNTPGTYSVSLTATNAFGSDPHSIVGYITVNAIPNASSSSLSNISCNGGSDGSATVAVSGGTPSYSYNWTPGNPTGDGTVTVTGLGTGTYTCTVTDANGCTDSQTFNITQPPAITFTSNTQSNISCFGGSDGAASVNAASGGAGGFTYDWTPGTPTGDGTIAVSGLAAGTYTCTATDVNGCTATRTFSITAPVAALDATRITNNVSCFGLSDGSCTVVPFGGTPGYTYSWAPLGGTGATASSLAAGSYTCTMTDANGCTRNKNFLVTQPPPLASVPSQSDVTCNGGTDGSATVVASGGTPGYTYSWAPSGGSAATASSIAAGNYTCTIVDLNGCSMQQTFTITEPLPIILSMSGSDENCNSTDGTATATPSQGNAPYTYLWAPGAQTSQQITNLSAGTYTCTVTDATGCSTMNTFVVNNIGCGGPPVAAFSGTPTTVCSGSTVAFTDLSTNTPTSWTWSFPGGTPSGSNAQHPAITYSTPGTYDVTLTASNASGSDPVNIVGYITVVAPPSAGGSVTHVSCFGGNDGAIDLTPSGNSPFTFAWSPSGQTTEDRTGLSNGSYSVTVTDVNGCTFQTSFGVNQPIALSRIMSKTDASCANNDGTATAAPSGGTAPYTYVWAPGGQTTQTATGLSSGTYTCTITDANGCTVNGSIAVVLVCGSTRLTNATCGITLTSLSQQVYCNPVVGATNYRYRWTNAAQGFSFVFVRNSNQTNCYGTWITGIQYGRTYNVEVAAFVGSSWTAYGPVCTVTTPAAIPTTQLIAGDCGSTVTSLSELIYATPVTGATQYEWRVSHPATSYSVTYIRNVTTADMRLQWITSIQYGLTYNVEVRAYVGGVWGNYGAICTVATPPLPTTQLTPAYCGATTASVSSPIYCNPVQNATNYQWKFINTSIGYSSTMMRGSALTSWYMSSNGGILTNTTYTVTVRAYVGGVWGAFGPPCTITTGPVQIAPNESQSEAMRAEEEICAANPGMCLTPSGELTMDIYPNPFAENLTVTTDASVRAVLIYNSFGEFVRSVDLENGKAEINLSDLASGIYLIQATSTSGMITKRVIKQ
jgi:PKD repeat protein